MNKKSKKLVYYYIQDLSKNVSSDMKLLLQKDNTYGGGTYFARSFRILYFAKKFVKNNKTLCSETRILKRTVYITELESYDKWELAN